MRTIANRVLRPLMRATDVVFDGVGLRPLGIVVFAASALLLVQLASETTGTIRAEAVATARPVDHPSLVSSFVSQVFVKPGDRVAVGAPLVELSPYFIDQRLARIDVEIEQMITEARLAQARLLVEEQRWVPPAARLGPDRPSLESPTEALYAKEIEALKVRRDMLLSEREALTVTSTFAGVIAQVAWPGASIAEGASVASILPEFADEIVAYVMPLTDPAAIAEGANAFILLPHAQSCRTPGRVLRRGAAVERAPSQLRDLFQYPMHGMPVHISIPPDCSLGIGQILTVEFQRSLS